MNPRLSLFRRCEECGELIKPGRDHFCVGGIPDGSGLLFFIVVSCLGLLALAIWA